MPVSSDKAQRVFVPPMSASSIGITAIAASVNGNVVALDPASGKQVWRNKLGIGLTAGPGVGEGLVVVVSEEEYQQHLDDLEAAGQTGLVEVETRATFDPERVTTSPSPDAGDDGGNA